MPARTEESPWRQAHFGCEMRNLCRALTATKPGTGERRPAFLHPCVKPHFATNLRTRAALHHYHWDGEEVNAHRESIRASVSDQMRFQLSNTRFDTLYRRFPAPPAKASDNGRGQGCLARNCDRGTTHNGTATTQERLEDEARLQRYWLPSGRGWRGGLVLPLFPPSGRATTSSGKTSTGLSALRENYGCAAGCYRAKLEHAQRALFHAEQRARKTGLSHPGTASSVRLP